ncbi:MAG: xanthine dehydrogenase molybdopterin binding subunit [Gammaproteobacteria bacterium]|nr:xanthine dehydrogenase molybdopterin binding subunit [Gammaproteobacteria bacterium]
MLLKTASLSLAQHHESAHQQVQGLAHYIDDLPLYAQTLHLAPVLSTIVHGHIDHTDWREVLQQPGVVGVFTGHDIKTDPLIGNFTHDEVILPTQIIDFYGQVIALVVAQTHEQAYRAATFAKINYTPLAPILNPCDSADRQQFVRPPVHFTRGHPSITPSDQQFSASLAIGGQEHYYLESQIAYSVPTALGEWTIYSSTQHPGEVQHWVAHALGIPVHKIRVICRRMGGGFGGKETQAGLPAIWASLCSARFSRPVKCRLDRTRDFLITGKRHPFIHQYEVGHSHAGKINKLISKQIVNCGFSADLSQPVADRAIFHTDNAYYIPHLHIDSYRSKVHTQSHTAFRGFGGPQGILLIESIISNIARRLDQDPLDVRYANLYSVGPDKETNTTHYGMYVADNILLPLIQQLEKSSNYRQRRYEIQQWNHTNPQIIKGIALVPVKFGISFTATQFNQAGALVHIYTDGSVIVHHGGTEMGQGLHTKVGQTVAQTLGIAHHQVLVQASDTHSVPNASATAASSGADLNAKAAEKAALTIKHRLQIWIAQISECQPEEVIFADGYIGTPQTKMSFVDWIKKAYSNRIQLWSDGFYATPGLHYDATRLQGTPFYYFVYAAACSEVWVDRLSGEIQLNAVDILYDAGTPLHRDIDIGQIEGGFIQGLGWLTTEELVWNKEGKLQTIGASTYKIPTAADTPKHFKIDFWHEPNPQANIGRSKAVGEPPLMLAISVFEAIRDAIAYTLPPRQCVILDAPATPEKIFMALQTKRD